MLKHDMGAGQFNDQGSLPVLFENVFDFSNQIIRSDGMHMQDTNSARKPVLK